MKLRDDPKKILIIRLSSLGDIVVLTSIFRRLRERFPSAQIDFVVKKEFKSLAVGNSFLSNVIAYQAQASLKGWLILCRYFREQKYDLFIDMHNNLRSKILGFYLRKTLRLRFHKPRLHRFLLFYCWINLFPRSFRLMDEYFKTLAPLKIKPDDARPEILLPQTVRKQAWDILSRNAICKPFVVILPIAAWKNKRYPLPKMEEVARRINEELQMSVVYLGSENDTYLDELQNLPAGKIVRITGQSNLEESIAILQESALVIGNDTGLTYAAEAVGVPVVLILGPTSHETGAGHYDSKSISIQKQLFCRPCSQKGDRICYRKHRYCMETITSDEILSAARQILTGEKK